MSKNVVVVDYGIGNVLSVVRAFEHCGAAVILSSEPNVIERADRLVLPGVGAFADGMQGLRDSGVVDSIREFCKENRPFLGICLGMQMMLDLSEEFGLHEGLGLCEGKVVKIPDRDVWGHNHKVPNIGWYALKNPKGIDWTGTILADFINREPEVYFVHSYMASPKYAENYTSYYEYGGHEITAMITKNYMYGCQFHPEKSGEIGLRMIRRFLEL